MSQTSVELAASSSTPEGSSSSCTLETEEGGGADTGSVLSSLLHGLRLWNSPPVDAYSVSKATPGHLDQPTVSASHPSGRESAQTTTTSPLTTPHGEGNEDKMSQLSTADNCITELNKSKSSNCFPSLAPKPISPDWPGVLEDNFQALDEAVRKFLERKDAAPPSRIESTALVSPRILPHGNLSRIVEDEETTPFYADRYADGGWPDEERSRLKVAPPWTNAFMFRTFGPGGSLANNRTMNKSVSPYQFFFTCLLWTYCQWWLMGLLLLCFILTWVVPCQIIVRSAGRRGDLLWGSVLIIFLILPWYVTAVVVSKVALRVAQAALTQCCFAGPDRWHVQGGGVSVSGDTQEVLDRRPDDTSSNMRRVDVDSNPIGREDRYSTEAVLANASGAVLDSAELSNNRIRTVHNVAHHQSAPFDNPTSSRAISEVHRRQLATSSRSNPPAQHMMVLHDSENNSIDLPPSDMLRPVPFRHLGDDTARGSAAGSCARSAISRRSSRSHRSARPTNTFVVSIYGDSRESTVTVMKDGSKLTSPTIEMAQSTNGRHRITAIRGSVENSRNAKKRDWRTRISSSSSRQDHRDSDSESVTTSRGAKYERRRSCQLAMGQDEHPQSHAATVRQRQKLKSQLLTQTVGGGQVEKIPWYTKTLYGISIPFIYATVDCLILPLTLFPFPKFRAFSIIRIVVFALFGCTMMFLLLLYTLVIYFLQCADPTLSNSLMPHRDSIALEFLLPSLFLNFLFPLVVYFHLRCVQWIYYARSLAESIYILFDIVNGLISRQLKERAVASRGYLFATSCLLNGVQSLEWKSWMLEVYYNPDVEHLDIIYPKYGALGPAVKYLGDTHASQLAQLLIVTPHLLSINGLALRELGDDVVSSIQIHHKLSGDPNLIAILCELLATSRTIQSVDLRNNDLGVFGAAWIAWVLQNNESIIFLDLAGTALGDNGVELMATAIMHNTTLEALSLKDNSIRKKGAKAIAKALKINKTLRRIYLNGNAVGPQGLLALQSAVKNNRVLEIFEIEWGGTNA